jgi:hypothetical protein
MTEGGGGGDDGEAPEEPGEKRQQLDETEIGSDIYHPKASDCSYNTGDNENKDPRLAKWRRLSSTKNGLTLPDELALVPNDYYLPSQTS